MIFRRRVVVSMSWFCVVVLCCCCCVGLFNFFDAFWQNMGSLGFLRVPQGSLGFLKGSLGFNQILGVIRAPQGSPFLKVPEGFFGFPSGSIRVSQSCPQVSRVHKGFQGSSLSSHSYSSSWRLKGFSVLFCSFIIYLQKFSDKQLIKWSQLLQIVKAQYLVAYKSICIQSRSICKPVFEKQNEETALY